eukprot:1102828-Prorocentrum_lima.AAC.1
MSDTRETTGLGGHDNTANTESFEPKLAMDTTHKPKVRTATDEDDTARKIVRKYHSFSDAPSQ